MWVRRTWKSNADTIVEVGLINASQGLAYNAQIQIICQPIHPALNQELQRLLAGQGFVRVLEPGKWKADISLGDSRLNLADVEIYFRDQAMSEWNRDHHLGTLTLSTSGPLFWATFPDTEDDKLRREQEGQHSIAQQELRCRRSSDHRDRFGRDIDREHRSAC